MGCALESLTRLGAMRAELRETLARGIRWWLHKALWLGLLSIGADGN